MSRELRPYPAYKDSGVEWIGEVPKKWEVVSLKHICKITMGQSPDSEFVNDKMLGLPFLQGNAEFTALYPEARHYCSEPKKISQQGDILFSVRAPVGAMNWSDKSYVIGRGLCSISSNKGNIQNYLWYVLNCLKVELFSKMTGSTFEAVTISDVRESNFILPPRQEQIAISEFLDQKTSEIDALIADKEKLISLLEEKRQAVITETVTKGLDRNAKMKDSGVEWIGEIPEHWEIIRLKFLVSNKTKKNKKEMELPYIGLENIESNTGVILSEISSDEVESESLLFDEGDVLFGKLRPYLKKATRVNFQGCCSSELLILNSDKTHLLSNLLPKILLSNDFIEYVNSSTYGAKMPRASWEFMRNIYVPLIPIEEQKIMVEKLDNLSENIFESIKELKKSIAQLKEYRESLIYEAVTGKIDLRGYEEEAELLVAERGEAYGD